MNSADDPGLLRNPTASELPDLLAELDKSGMGVAAFARERGLKPQNLYVARRRVRPKATPATIFDPIRVSSVGGAQAHFTLELHSGHKLLVPGDFESSSLRRLLEILNAC